MRLVTYLSTTGPRVGRIVGDRIVDLGCADMTQFLAEPDWWERARAGEEVCAEPVTLNQPHAGWTPAVGAKSRGGHAPLAEARLMAPVPRPGKFICIGLNYSDHAAESNLPVPKAPVLFAKFATSVSGPVDAIPHPGEDLTTQMDWEIELGVVIGRTCRRVTPADALGCVAGYTVINDVSARDLQWSDGQWLKGKCLDGFAPMGPHLVTTDEIPDPQKLRLTMQVNGRTVQDGNTEKMIFSVAELVSYLSRLMTLEPGDVIATGTPAGVGAGMKPPVWLKLGDVCRGEIDGIGVIENRVVES